MWWVCRCPGGCVLLRTPAPNMCDSDSGPARLPPAVWGEHSGGPGAHGWAGGGLPGGLTVLGHVSDGHAVLLGHVPQEGEDHEAGGEARQGVDRRGDDRVSGKQDTRPSPGLQEGSLPPFVLDAPRPGSGGLWRGLFRGLPGPSRGRHCRQAGAQGGRAPIRVALGSGCVQALAQADPMVANHARLPRSQEASDTRTRCKGEMVRGGCMRALGRRTETNGAPTHAQPGMSGRVSRWLVRTWEK